MTSSTNNPRGAFRATGVNSPRVGVDLVDRALDAVVQATGETQKKAISNGRLTDEITLGVLGATQSIEHGLGRKPMGWTLAYQLGFQPKFRVTSVDEKRINIRSLDQVDVCGMFSTDGAGAVSTQPTGAMVVVSYAGGFGLYNFLLTFTASTFLSAEASTTMLDSRYGIRLSTSALPTVGMVHLLATAPSAIISRDVPFRISVTGTEPKFRLWVF